MKICKPTPRIKIITPNYIAKIPIRKILVIQHLPTTGNGELIHIGTKKNGQILKKILSGKKKTENFVNKHYIDFATKTRSQANQILDILFHAKQSKKSYTIHLETKNSIDGKEIIHNFEITEQPNKLLKFKQKEKK